MKTALQTRKEDGYCSVDRVPYGDQIKGDRQIQIVEKAAVNVRKIFELASSGMDCTSIASLLIQQEPQSNWSTVKVWRICHNPIYTGYRVWHKYEQKYLYTGGLWSAEKGKTLPEREWKMVPDAQMKIVSSQIYDRVQEKKRTYREKRQKAHIFMGITRCGNCGKGMSRHRRDSCRLICRQCSIEMRADICCDTVWQVCREAWRREQSLKRNNHIVTGESGTEIDEKEWQRRIWVRRFYIKYI